MVVHVAEAAAAGDNSDLMPIMPAAGALLEVDASFAVSSCRDTVGCHGCCISGTCRTAQIWRTSAVAWGACG